MILAAKWTLPLENLGHFPEGTFLPMGLLLFAISVHGLWTHVFPFPVHQLPSAACPVVLWTDCCVLSYVEGLSWCDGVWRWDLWEVIGFRWVVKVGPHDGFSALIRTGRGWHVRTQQEGGCLQATPRGKLLCKLAVYGILLQQPELPKAPRCFLHLLTLLYPQGGSLLGWLRPLLP
jgi:hypothetical protein